MLRTGAWEGTLPLYEYYCESCEGVFERLRSTRAASSPEPCPVCDQDARRIISKEWSAFTFRKGHPRQLPDTGGYWHLGQRVKTLASRSPNGVDHPELHRQRPPREPTVEDVERYEEVRDIKREQDMAVNATVRDVETDRQEARLRRAFDRPANARTERARRRAMRRIAAEDAKAGRQIRGEIESARPALRRRLKSGD